MKSWRSYRSKASQVNETSSIAKDEVALLVERLEFFIPRLIGMMKTWQWVLYIITWSLFVTVIDRYSLLTFSDFMIKFASRAFQNVMTIIPAFYLIDYWRPIFKRLNPIQVSAYVVLLLVIGSIITIVTTMLVRINLGVMDYDRQAFILNIFFNAVITGGFTIVFLLYFMRRYRELLALKLSFEQKILAQNDIMKARIAPHFFFNTINSLISLIETNPPRAADLLQNVSALFRASFSGTREISFEEEIALCEHYLAIESCRLSDKLLVNWQLPDDDVMYDMVITALTLQGVLEKMLLNVVESTTETIQINIEARWQQHRVVIIVTVDLPSKTLMVAQNLRQKIDFRLQVERMRLCFGQSARIDSTISNKQVVTTIDYPLQDVVI